jgi:hypothetical protein
VLESLKVCGNGLLMTLQLSWTLAILGFGCTQCLRDCHFSVVLFIMMDIYRKSWPSVTLLFRISELSGSNLGPGIGYTD